MCIAELRAMPLVILAAMAIVPVMNMSVGADSIAELPLIRKAVRVGFSNGGWKYDRYKDLQSLDAHTRMTLADLQGPGVIKHIHTTRHHPSELFARGIVLEIYFDDAQEPAVLCPLADFFGDGCNGRAMDFSSRFIECAPWSYNCYFPMPFKSRARIILRNDTGKDAGNYCYVEWESLPEWNPGLGYFHATYQRKAFQLTNATNELFFHVQGAGHVIGRQFSIATDEPRFRDFTFVMEGNNEIDIDGKPRAIDYLGTEDSFGFSWGFQKTFGGLHAGMSLVEHGDRNFLSVYRFHDSMPLRFNRELLWRINWEYERSSIPEAAWRKAAAQGGLGVDYATVHYWYQDVPGGYHHQPLHSVEERKKPLLRPVTRRVGDSGPDQ